MRLLASPPAGVEPWHPWSLVATVGGAGLLRLAPGTFGSLAGLAFAAGAAGALGVWGLVGLLAVAVALGVPAADHVGRSGERDAPAIVVDEVAGQVATVCLVALVVPVDALGPLAFGIAFAAFRLFDVVKPGPIGWIDRHVGGGWGVMADDLAAAAPAAASTLALLWLLDGLGGPPA